MRWIKRLLTASAVLSVLSLGTAPLVYADNTVAQPASVTISGIVLAKRQIVIDPSRTIIQIFSNTDENVTPEVTLGNATGPIMTLDAALTTQYELLRPQFRPAATGLIYQQPVYTLTNIISTLNRTDLRAQSGAPSAPARLWPWLIQ